MIRMSNLYGKLHLWFFNLILWLKRLLPPCDCRNRSVFLKNHCFSKFEIFICATFFTAKGQTQFFQKKWFNWWNCETLFVIYIYIYITFCVGYYCLQIWIMRGFQLAQLVKSLVVEQGTWVQIPPTPKTNWCLGLMVRATIMSGRHRFKNTCVCEFRL